VEQPQLILFSAIQEQISQLSSIAVAGGERQDAIENILAGISRLSNEVSDASDYVPAYDQRLYSEVWSHLGPDIAFS
jgi:hypothetical protein